MRAQLEETLALAGIKSGQRAAAGSGSTRSASGRARRPIIIVIAACTLFGQGAWAAPGDISTVAGGGVGDGGPARSALIFNPTAVTVDSAGNLFIADYYNHRIRKVDSSGTITTVAGGQYGFSGDGGPATSASFRNPAAVTVDSSGNLFIADSYNNRIRKVDSSGTITTVAGNGMGAFAGDEVPATSASLNRPKGVAVDSSGNLLIADGGNNRIRKVSG